MTDRETLIELIQNAVNGCARYWAENIADYLLANDVIVQERGEWIEDGYNGCPCVCSYCGEEAQYISRFQETFDYDWEENLVPTGYEELREYIRTPYCSKCGARMEREG